MPRVSGITIKCAESFIKICIYCLQKVLVSCNMVSITGLYDAVFLKCAAQGDRICKDFLTMHRTR